MIRVEGTEVSGEDEIALLKVNEISESENQ